MARINNLTNFLNDVATAIKTKLGDDTPIPASQFDTKIGEIETVGTYQSKTINISANGSQTVTPDTGYDALSSVAITVAVPVKQLQSKTYEFTNNTHIILSPEQGYDGFSSIDLTINVPGSTINNQDKTITENGTYQADQGYTGIGTATVNVQPDVELFTTETELDTYIETNYNKLQSGKKAVIYGDEQIFSIAPKELFTEVYLPPQIVLDEPITRNILIGYYSQSQYSSGSWELDDFLNPTTFYGGFHTQSGMLNFRYSSEDGITYIRESVNAYDHGWGPSDGSWHWDEDTSIATFDGANTYFYYNARNGGVNILTQLFRKPKTMYNGIYQYINKNDGSYRKYTANVNTILSSGVPAELDLCKLWYTPSYYVRWGINPTITTKQGLSVLTFTEQFGYNADPVIFKDGNIYRIGLRVSASQSYRTDSTKSISYTKYISTESGATSETITKYYKDMPYWTYSSSSYYYFFELYNTTDISKLYIIRGTQNSYCNISYITVSSGSTYSSTTYSVGSATYTSNTALWTKQVCDTQMSLTNPNQLLPGYTGYGTNQPITGDGSIYNNLDDYEVETNIYNLTSTDKGYFSQLPTKAITDITTRRSINWLKNNNNNIDSNHYISFPSLTGNSIPAATALEGYYISYQLYNVTNNKIISLQSKSTSTESGYVYSYRFVVQDGSTLEILHNTEYSTTRAYTNFVQTNYGNYIYVYNSYSVYNSSISKNTYYLQLYRYDLSTYTRTTIIDKSSTISSITFGGTEVDKKYLVHTYRIVNSGTTFYIYSYIVDLFTGTSYTILNGVSYNETMGTSYDYSHISVCNTSTYIYVYYALGYFGARGARLHRFTKSSNAISTLWTSAYGEDDTIDVLNYGYEDTNYVYFGKMPIPKSSKTDYMTYLDNVVDTDGNTMFSSNTPIGSLYYIGTSMYLLQGYNLYHIVDNTWNMTLNSDKYIVTATIDKRYVLPNKNWAYSLNSSDNVLYKNITPSMLDFGTLTEYANYYTIQSYDTTLNIKCINCINGDSTDFDYSVIYNGTDIFVQKMVD